ncbi:MAG: class I SAM-dependent methyltransferase [Candidatus Nanoarchaeia archaeon]
MKTESIETAIRYLFNKEIHGRTFVHEQEEMTRDVAVNYDLLGRNNRKNTYKRIVEDFKNKTGCYAMNFHSMDVGTILDVGCGSGLLSFELAEQTNGKIIGIDSSTDMIRLANTNYERLKMQDESFCGRIEFIEKSVYSLEELEKINDVNFILCRNVFHRLYSPKLALEQMYSALAPKGKIFIRDLKRDAEWSIVLERIGDERWKKLELVKDYVGAMASMFTVFELDNLLRNMNLNYEFFDGSYNCTRVVVANEMKEYERETEYVCIITK